MLTVNEVSKLSNVSVRTLHYYDEIGLLHPTDVTEAGYRLYDDAALDRLQQILLFRELEFPLKEITTILDNPNYSREKALEQQIELLTLKKQHMEKLISYAREIKITGEKNMDFSVFDTKTIDEYSKKAKEQWGDTQAYKEYEEKSKDRTESQTNDALKKLMIIFTEFGKMMDKKPEDEIVQNQVYKLQRFITDNFYNCTNEILAGLGVMYSAGGEFTDNINKYGGEGCADFTSKAIVRYCAANI